MYYYCIDQETEDVILEALEEADLLFYKLRPLQRKSIVYFNENWKWDSVPCATGYR